MTDYIALADKLADYANGDEFQRVVEEAERVIRALATPATDYIALAREVGAYVNHSTIGGDPKNRTRHYAFNADQLAAFAAHIAQAAPSVVETQPGSPNFDGADAWNASLSVAPSQDREDAALLALERITHSYRLLLAGKPVRDAAETLAEADAALAARQAPKEPTP